MNLERKKILKMLANGTITPEEADELLDTLQNDDYVEAEFVDSEDESLFSKNFKEELLGAKEDLIKAKDWMSKEIKKVNLNSMKEKLKNGLVKVDKALAKVDQQISDYGKKIKERFTANNNKEEDE